MAALWKQDGKLDPTFESINRCLLEDWFLLPYELRLQRAHAKALRETSISQRASTSGAPTAATVELLTNEEYASLIRAIDALERAWVDSEEGADADRHSAARPVTAAERISRTSKTCPESDAEDLHTWVEAELTALAGDAGRKIHTARSRNDQVATLLKLYVIDAGERLVADLAKLSSLFCRRAEIWSELIFPLQTHTQFAAPGTVGFWVMRYATALDRVRRRVRAAVALWREECPLGSGAVAGSSIPLNREIQARELGFVRPSRNALDSTTCRDEVLDWLALATLAALHLQSFATDVIAFSQTQPGWTKYPRAFATGSSMMPNKLNPDAMELLRGECCQVAAAHGQAVLLLKGLPSGYNRDLQCIKPVLRGAVERLHTMLCLTTAFVEQLDFDRERLAASLSLGQIGATLRMEQKVLDGLPLRTAHHAVTEELLAAGATDDAGWASRVELYLTSGGAGPSQTRVEAAALLAELRKDHPSL